MKITSTPRSSAAQDGHAGLLMLGLQNSGRGTGCGLSAPPKLTAKTLAKILATKWSWGIGM